MSAIGYRQKGDNGPLYNPERDYAYITPTLMRTAIERLEVNLSEEQVAWKQAHNITPEEISAAVIALAEAQRDFVNSADPVSDFLSALYRHNFMACRQEVRQFVFSVIGEVFCAAWFTAVREVSAINEESPAQPDMARFTAAVRSFVNTNRGSTYDAFASVENMRMLNDTLRGRVKSLMLALHDCQDKMRQCEEAAAQSAQPKANLISWLTGHIWRKKK